jgi:tRNA U34 5-methylaminomethyl-2-thiouridine-forming methyltransferase MnmC
MKRSIITTKDGSKTIRLEDWDEHYHSTHGAIQESQHVYIEAGLDFYNELYHPKNLKVLEAGFGTGLNAFLTYFWAEHHGVSVDYAGLEAYPVSSDEHIAMEYHSELVSASAQQVYEDLHKAKWEEWTSISKAFQLKKNKMFFSDVKLKQEVDIVFYDAFGPRVQPELWEAPLFQKFYEALTPGGVFVTYCVKGTARRALQAIGFEVDIIEGPPGKRHMMRAQKPCQ